MTTWKKFLSIPGATLLAVLLAVPAFAADVTVNLVAEQVNVAMADGTLIPMWGLRDAAGGAGTATVPGPTIRLTAGDNLIINLTNDLGTTVTTPGAEEPVSLVINGLKATEAGAMTPTWTDNSTGNRTALTQRVRSFTHEVAPGATGTYRWDGVTSGTYLLESGTHQAVQIPMGLYAAVVVDEVANAQAYPDASTAYSDDAVLLFSEVDPVLNAAVAAGEYGSAPGTGLYTTSMGMGYLPRYFLINGTSYAAGAATPIQIGSATGSKLLRFLNAGSRTRNPVLQGDYMTLIGEDGNPASYQLQQYSIYLPAGKTMDALFSPTAARSYPLYDRSLGLSNGTTSPGGMLAYLAATTVVAQPARIGVFRSGQWYLDANGNGAWDSGTDLAYASFGGATDIPVTGDWNGDGTTQIGTFRDGQWFLDANGNGAWDAGVDTTYSSFGQAGDIPVTGDWNGDGLTQIGVFRAGTWYLDSNGNGVLEPLVDTVYASFGMASDVPVTGDWNGNGVTKIGVFRGGAWYLDSNGNGVWDGGIDTAYDSFGGASDVPVVGDWSGDGIEKIGVFRSGAWYLDADGSGAWEAGTDTAYPSFGAASGDLPIIGNW